MKSSCLVKAFASITQQRNPTLQKNVSDKSRCIEDLAPDSLGVFDQSIYSTSNSSSNSKIFLSKKKHKLYWFPAWKNLMSHLIVVKHTKVSSNCPGNQGPSCTRFSRKHWKTKGAIIHLKTQLGEIPTLKLEKQWETCSVRISPETLFGAQFGFGCNDITCFYWIAIAI